MTDTSPAMSEPTGDARKAGRFTALPKTRLGWSAAAVGAAYVALVVILQRTVLGLPTWLDFTLGLAPGAIALALLVLAVTRSRERSWVLWLVGAGVLWGFGGFVIFALMVL